MADDSDWQSKRRALGTCLLFLAPCAVIALSLFSIIKDEQRYRASLQATSSSGIPRVTGSMVGATATVAPSNVPLLETAELPVPQFLDEADDGEPKAATKAPVKRYATVQQAALESCSTASVEGLSRQIIQQARCIKPSYIVPLPTRPNLVLASNVFPYLEAGARDHLLRALDANPSKKMTINSAFRTVAQQFLVSRWAAGKRCGVPLATPPGESNHEAGTALDIAEAAQWRTALEAQKFRWLGASDRVHFDYQGGGASAGTATDVLAFQMLWNRNHRADSIPTNGLYTAATERRLRKAPATGFPIGPSCGKAGAAKRP